VGLLIRADPEADEECRHEHKAREGSPYCAFRCERVHVHYGGYGRRASSVTSLDWASVPERLDRRCYRSGVNTVQTRRSVDPVPAPALLAFWLGVLAALVGLVALLIVVGSGVAGDYSQGAIAAWAATSAAMVALFGAAIWIGARETRRRQIDGAFIRRDVALAIAALLGGVITVSLVAADIGGAFLPVLADLLAVAFVASLVGSNLHIWRRLRSQPE
jgi:hypothetical protein